MCKSKNIFLVMDVNEVLLNKWHGWKEFPWIQVLAQQLSLQQNHSSAEALGTCIWPVLYPGKTRGVIAYFLAKLPPFYVEFPTEYIKMQDLTQAWRNVATHWLCIMRMNTQCSPLNWVHTIVTSSGVSLWSFSKAEIPLVGTEDSPFVKKPLFLLPPRKMPQIHLLTGIYY